MDLKARERKPGAEEAKIVHDKWGWNLNEIMEERGQRAKALRKQDQQDTELWEVREREK